MDTDEAALPLESEEGVDLTLVRWMLSLTPAERVEKIALKESAGRNKDKAALPTLRATLAEKQRTGQ